MTTGSDGDDEELLLEELEPEPSGPALAPAPPVFAPPAPPIPSAALIAEPAEGAEAEGPPPFAEAEAQDDRADAALFQQEADAEPEAERRAALLLEIARLAEATGDAEAALRASRAAFEAAPSFVAAFGPLRRLLAAAGLWD